MSGDVTIKKVEVERVSVISSKPFVGILKKLEAQIGHPDTIAFTKAVAAAESYGELEKIVQKAMGTSGLMEFTRFNLGEIIRKERGPGSPNILRLVAHHETDGRSCARCCLACAREHFDR